MALELARHDIRVNALAPGYVITEINQELPESDENVAHHIKHNHTAYPDALVREAEGFAALRSALEKTGVTEIRIPDLLAIESDRLTMRRIEAVPASKTNLVVLGEGLARLHSVPQDYYGWSEDNYIGLSPQPNILSSSWGDFFVEHRLGYQLSRIEYDTPGGIERT